MAEFKFACPLCNGHITCDELWSGHEIQCPICNGTLTVPAKPAQTTDNPLVPKPPAGPSPRLSLGGASQKPAQTGLGNIPIRNLAPPPAKKQNPALKILKIAVVLAALGVGGYFGYGFVMKMQDKANAKSREAEKNADGGQVGHIADLYGVLDATEPGGGGLGGGPRGSGPKARRSEVGQEIPVPNAPPGGQAAQPTAIVAPVYTLDATKAKIPDGRANGMLGGTNFLPDTIRIDQVGAAQVLRLTQGSLMSPDRELLVYLRLKAGEKLGGYKLSITPEMKGVGVPQIVKRWKNNPRYAAQMKTFGTGYQLKLELGEPTEGQVPGKVYLALPDPEQSVVAGAFQAASSLTEGGAAVDPAATGAAEAPSGAEREMFEKRYGIRK